MDKKIRQIFQDRVQKGLHGPGSDTWGLPDIEEIISDYPLIRYFTGIIFPDKSIPKSQDESDAAQMENISKENEDEVDITNDDEKDENTNDVIRTKEIEEYKLNHNNFFPTNIGISVCLPNKIKELNCTFSFGVYNTVKSPKELKINISQAGYDSFFDENIPYQLPFKDVLKFDGKFMFLERKLKGNKGGKNKRSEEYLAFDAFKKKSNLKDSSAKYYINFLEKLIGRAWKRTEIILDEIIPIANTKHPVTLDVETKSKLAKAGYNVKVIEKDKHNYVKIQLVNLSEKQAANKFSKVNESLNTKCFFQTRVKVKSEHILAYNENQLSTFDINSEFADPEAIELDFLYRDVKKYAVGHNCSAIWDDDFKPSFVETTFLPEQNIKDTINSFDSKNVEMNQTLDIKNMSIWGLPQNDVIANLNFFVKGYDSWISKQIESNSQNSGQDKEVGENIIKRQKSNLERLNKNIELLKDKNTFHIFQLANTAMFIQLIVSNDKDFGSEERELSDAKSEYLNSLEFFENYDAEKRKSDAKIDFIPAYRPFQLAFLLLNIEGMAVPNSKDRNEIVDLIWFPTGGGKTEAYLAVAAFTMLYRRISNPENYAGTAVIMRYTLRLLTAQQFERASRLICALEFLRKNKVAKNLGDDSFSIGLWVGKASTPNDLKTVAEKMKIFDSESKKRKNKVLNGRPFEKNVFQISSCPWCGTKLILKGRAPSGKEIWKTGFKHRPNKTFNLFCINKKCSFHSEIPVQVVDEILYKQPPTLLFGTVDKFAMLAWREKANQFFNSISKNGLPPDLIIQDELHLLSGPLGSITGLFESLIELLSTKGNRKPKIIASTATTRNTTKQIENLYGNRTVNVFPPTGLTYNDSYFAKESTNESKRRYIGIMPTGKTSVNTQLHIIAHLLVARLEALREFEQKKQININDYWTIVSYYNTLKDVGRTFNKIVDDISPKVSALQNLLSKLLSPLSGSHIYNYNFNWKGLAGRTKELTSRIDSSKIKATLKELENEFSQDKIEEYQSKEYENKGNYLQNVVDLVLATNMISVGIDISRLNVMLINGIPKNIAEYIQASSRVGRNTQGLVITHFDPNRAREKSYFEHFKGFHQAFYKSVEPLSVTPFTENTIEKMMASLLITYVRNKIPDMAQNINAKEFTKEMADELKKYIKMRFASQSNELNVFEQTLDKLTTDWIERIKINSKLKYDELLKRPSSGGSAWETMQSMREIDTSTWIQIKETF